MIAFWNIVPRSLDIDWRFTAFAITLMMEAVCIPEMSVYFETTWCYIPDAHRPENFKCQTFCTDKRIWRYDFICRFVPDKEFSGADRTATRSGPIQFETEEEDPFGLDQFLTQAKHASKRLMHDRDPWGVEEHVKRRQLE
jgi:hypothetical protein